MFDFIDNLKFFDISWASITLAIVVLLASIFLRKVFSRVVVTQLKKLADAAGSKMAVKVVETVGDPLGFGFLVLGVYVATRIILLPGDLEVFADNLLQSLITFTVFWVIYRAVEPFAFFFNRVSDVFGTTLTEELSNFFATSAKILTVLLGVMAILQSWGINVVAFLGGLGIAGIAVALAAQDTVKNFFGSLAIFVDHTFNKGDIIKTTDVEGMVLHIGLRTTSIRQHDRGVVVIPNATLANSAIINYSRRPHRRVRWSIPLRWETPADRLKKLTNRIRQWLEESPEIETDPKVVTTVIRLEQIEDGTLKLLCQFFPNTPNWEEYLRITEQCLYAFKQIFEEEDIHLAYPKQSVVLEQDSVEILKAANH